MDYRVSKDSTVIHYSQMVKVMNKRFAVLDEGLADSFAVGGLLAAVKAAPSPQKTTTSTGRYKASLTVSTRHPERHDPGPLGSFQVPDESDARFGLVGRRPGDDVFINAGVGYSDPVEFMWNYRVMEAAHNIGERRMEKDHKKILSRVGKTK